MNAYSPTSQRSGQQDHGQRVVLFLHTTAAPSPGQVEQLAARSSVLEGLGVHPVEATVGDVVIGTRAPAAANWATSVPGVYAAGNVTDPLAQIITAVVGR